MLSDRRCGVGLYSLSMQPCSERICQKVRHIQNTLLNIRGHWRHVFAPQFPAPVNSEIEYEGNFETHTLDNATGH